MKMKWTTQYSDVLFYTVFFCAILVAIGVTFHTIYIQQNYEKLAPTMTVDGELITDPI